ncbi:MAG: hypothetical protein G3M70_10355 [Candidatus Nitronauta litoralis]|uniref:Uncharacterized protein n=1 Tax=Candidatus Nitronauta litoralis TaxID=2705533 RepID=A0A7T0G0F6_9BACT|nr:MAG: hypothetical protein G3M70_10355 [Candidatus Nitronauta litoralis]
MTIQADAGSFRDPGNKVYRIGNSVLRGMDPASMECFNRLNKENFYQEFLKNNFIVSAVPQSPENKYATEILKYGWAGVLEHDLIPFISYPYEWTFSMLKDAALLQLHLIESSLEHDWTLKDATSYNIQWNGILPIFIDTPSLVQRTKGEQWVGYRQFCMLYLIPLMLKAYTGIQFNPLLRSQLDGVSPIEAANYFKGLNRFKKGVLTHIIFPATVETRIVKNKQIASAQKRIQHTRAMVLGLVQGLQRLVQNLEIKMEDTVWSQYDKTHSYMEDAFNNKKLFVEKYVSLHTRRLTWDLGSNTGTFSEISARHSDYVVAVDADHDAVEKLYRKMKREKQSKILPLFMDLSNLSPGQGWRGAERKAFDNREQPSLVICLALIHHIVISKNIPIAFFLDWLRELNCEVIIEFVTPEDEMVQKLLSNKSGFNPDYELETFIREASERFNIVDQMPLKDAKRHLFYLTPNH